MKSTDTRARAQGPLCVFARATSSNLFCAPACFIYFLFLFFNVFFWLRWVFVAARRLFSSCGERGPLFVVGRGLLIAVASVVVEHGF